MKKQPLEIWIEINEQNIIEWVNEGEDLPIRRIHGAEIAKAYAAEVAKGMRKLNPSAIVDVKLGTRLDRRIEVDGVADYIEEMGLLEELYQDYDAVTDELINWDWLPEWAA